MASFLKRLFSRPPAPGDESAPITEPAPGLSPASEGGSPPVEAASRQPETITVTALEQATRYVSEEIFAQVVRDKLSATDLTAQQLHAWTCAKCGAALPRETGECDTVTCGYCATIYRLPRPKKRSSGIQISGNVSVGGDIIGGDQVIIHVAPPPTAEPAASQTPGNTQPTMTPDDANLH